MQEKPAVFIYGKVRQPPELMHYGIKGQKWGVRRFQYENGSYTTEGKERYGRGSKNSSESNKKQSSPNVYRSNGTSNGRKEVDKLFDNRDYDAASKFDFAGQHALSEYKRGGRDAAEKAISSQLKGYKYEYSINDDKSSKDSYSTYSLRVHGNGKAYEVFGDDEYSDDQSFVRTDESSKKGLIGGIKSRGNKDPNARENWKAKDVSKLSDEELRRRNNRLQAEQQYKSATTPEWKKEAKQIAKDSFKRIFVATAVTAMTAIVAKNYKDIIGPFISSKVSKPISTIVATNMLRKEINRKNHFDNRGPEILGKHVGQR